MRSKKNRDQKKSVIIDNETVVALSMYILAVAKQKQYLKDILE